MVSSRSIVELTAAAALTIALAGFSSGEPDPAGTKTSTVTVSPSPSPSTTPSSSPTADSPQDSSSGTGSCSTSELTGTLGEGSGGAAGSIGVRLVLTNTSAKSCILQGWPGVSFVGGGNGTQIGVPAKQDRSGQYPHDTVTLAAGGAASVPLLIAQALDYSMADCQPRDADGFRVYPPGQKGALFIADAGVKACAGKGVVLPTASAVQPAG
ncbi:DUF4232 domain-containing protein [Glaciihabitans sp. UYNi722]|uniref:DUF4232 domain-containing protein n=1 Tax=Glaciihabitans sp. UYNi722 TaxID=3156344 RepID=UPI0033961D0E